MQTRRLTDLIGDIVALRDFSDRGIENLSFFSQGLTLQRLDKNDFWKTSYFFAD